MQKKSFESEFDKICEEKHREKEKKKKQYNENIRSHIVYMDENGKIYKRDSQKINTEYYKSSETGKNRKRKDVTKVFIIFMIVVIIYLVFDLFNVGINIY